MVYLIPSYLENIGWIPNKAIRSPAPRWAVPLAQTIGDSMKTRVDLLIEMENILLKLLAQYQSNQYVLLTQAIGNVRILKALGNPTMEAVGLGIPDDGTDSPRLTRGMD